MQQYRTDRSPLVELLDELRSFEGQSLLFATVFVLVGVGLPLLYADQPLHIDETIFIVIGQALAEGAELYTGVIDHKPPGVFYVASAISALGFETYLAFRAVTALVVVVTGLLVFRLGTMLYDEPTGMVASVLFLVATYLPHFDGFFFLTEPYAVCCTVVAATLFLTAERVRSHVGVGVTLGIGVLFNQIVFLFGAAILAFATLRLWLLTDRSRVEFARTGSHVVAIGVGFLAVVGAAMVSFASTGALAEFLTYAFVVPLTRYDPPFLVTGHVYMALSLLPVWLVAVGMVVRTLVRLRARRVDEATLFVALWAAFIAYPGLTQYGGDHKMLFTFPAVALLTAVALRLGWRSAAVRSRVGSLVARARGRPDVSVSVRTLVTVLLVGGLVVSAVGFNVVYGAHLVDDNIAEQRAAVQQIDQYVEGPVYAFPFFWQVVYFADDVSLPNTYVGGVYTDGLARTVVDHLDEERVAYVVVPAGHVTDSGDVRGNRFFRDTDTQVATYIETHYEPVTETDEYVVYRRQGDGA
ncbi:ArnT family glycosyltransferase [Salinigranum halophilum]|uniref:ArnT family glycosyltransferase n=1 Tax=Salinigranum halophilum TaxID=2565931 RepID=UPI00115CFC64|nr:glycosyltransferase family 39 protein [Salinigranum halophilum]